MNQKWPKTLPPLSAAQQAISDDFMKVWHEHLPRYSRIERFNHGWVVEHAPASFRRALEVGAGLGQHLAYERLTPDQEAAYVCLELRENMAAAIRKRHPRIQAIVGDCQERIAFPDGHFDRIIAVHVLEHLPNLPAAIRELHRVCDKARGMLQVVLPCEGSLAYGLARRISAQRVFEKRYRQPYRWFIEREHLSVPREIEEELAPYFAVERRAYFPFPVPLFFCNLCVAMNLRPRT